MTLAGGYGRLVKLQTFFPSAFCAYTEDVVLEAKPVKLANIEALMVQRGSLKEKPNPAELLPSIPASLAIPGPNYLCSVERLNSCLSL